MRSKSKTPPSTVTHLRVLGNHRFAISLCCLLGLTATSQAAAPGPEGDGDRVIEIKSGC